MKTHDLAATVLAEQTHLRLPSRLDWVGSIVEYLKHKAIQAGVCQESRAGKLLVALHEALTNAIIHGNLELSSELRERDDGSFSQALNDRLANPTLAGRHVDVVVDYDGERCRWIITDQGNGFDVARALSKAESNDPELMLASGRGIIIMRSFLDDVRYELGGRRIILTMLKSSGTEKRRTDRVGFCQPVRVAPIREDGSVDWQASLEAVASNISANGLAMVLDQDAAMQRMAIGLQGATSQVYLPAEIRHSRTLAGDAVEIGCQFAPDPPIAEATVAAAHAVAASVQALLQRLAEAKTQAEERRAEPRLPFHQPIKISGGDAPAIDAVVRNLSRSGLACLATVPVPLGECVLHVFQPEGPTLVIKGQIVRCQPIRPGLYDVGARFGGAEELRHG